MFHEDRFLTSSPSSFPSARCFFDCPVGRPPSKTRFTRCVLALPTFMVARAQEYGMYYVPCVRTPLTRSADRISHRHTCGAPTVAEMRVPVCSPTTTEISIMGPSQQAGWDCYGTKSGGFHLFWLGSDMSLRAKSSIREILIILHTFRKSARNAMLS